MRAGTCRGGGRKASMRRIRFREPGWLPREAADQRGGQVERLDGDIAAAAQGGLRGPAGYQVQMRQAERCVERLAVLVVRADLVVGDDVGNAAVVRRTERVLKIGSPEARQVPMVSGIGYPLVRRVQVHNVARAGVREVLLLSLIHISEPTRLGMISYA